MRIEVVGLFKITFGFGFFELLYLKYKKLKWCKVIKKWGKG